MAAIALHSVDYLGRNSFSPFCLIVISAVFLAVLYSDEVFMLRTIIRKRNQIDLEIDSALFRFNQSFVEIGDLV